MEENTMYARNLVPCDLIRGLNFLIIEIFAIVGNIHTQACLNIYMLFMCPQCTKI